jgi:hypothetical protein
MSTTTPWSHGLSALLALALLGGFAACGSSSPEGPAAGPATGSANISHASLAVSASAGQASTQSARLQTTTPQALLTDARSPAPDSRVQPAAASTDPSPSDAQTTADQAQREARELWFTELRESPDATVRLQALETWAQQPGEGIDPLTFALVDEDEDVRARAEALWEQQLTREEAETAP